MNIIKAMYFSPTHTTEQIVQQIAERLHGHLGYGVEKISITKAAQRDKQYALDKKDILVLGLPVYAGRIPAITESTLKQLIGNNTPAVIVAVYGNRDYDDTLLEMKDMLSAQGFIIVAAGAFIGEHSFSYKLASSRPDGQDMLAASEFATQTAKKLESIIDDGNAENITVKGSNPYKKRAVTPAFAPKTKESCNECMICYNECPTGAISTDPKVADAQKCIRCCACVKSCPLDAKYFDNEIMLKSTIWLEENFMPRKEPEIFI